MHLYSLGTQRFSDCVSQQWERGGDRRRGLRLDGQQQRYDLVDNHRRRQRLWQWHGQLLGHG